MSSPIRFRQMPTTSTVVTRSNGRPTITARGVVAQRRQRLTADGAKDPAEVAKSVNFLQEDIAQATASLRNEPETGAIIFMAVPVTSGTVFTLVHNFGRPFQGYRVTRTYTGASAPITLQDAALPAGATFSAVVALKPTGTGTCDIRVW